MQHSGFESFWESLKKKLFELHIFFTGILAGTHYNRAWIIHSILLEALERLLISRFIRERNITFSDEIKEYFAEGNCDGFYNSIVDMLSPLAAQVRIVKRKSANWWTRYNTTVLVNLSWPHIFVNNGS